MGVIAQDEVNDSWSPSHDRGQELVRLDTTRPMGLSFNQRCLLSGLTHHVNSDKAKRVLIRLASMDKCTE